MSKNAITAAYDGNEYFNRMPLSGLEYKRVEVDYERNYSLDEVNEMAASGWRVIAVLPYKYCEIYIMEHSVLVGD